jgi:hypothetical protein
MDQVIIAREFSGAPLYLIRAHKRGNSFEWSRDRSNAMHTTVPKARALIERAQAWEANAYMVDVSENVLVPAASKAARPVRWGVAGAVTRRCADCGRAGYLTGHMECEYPGRVSDRRAS